MRGAGYVLCILTALCLMQACAHVEPEVRVASSVEDGVRTFALVREDGEETSLFRIVEGGNIECIGDMVVTVGEARMACFVIADYGQENMIYYILSDVATGGCVQSGRVNLSAMGIADYAFRAVAIDSISEDSVYLRGGNGRISVESSAPDWDSDRIINYYEYE